jgi:tRNA(fMet)-specific endonuclease VapC
VRYLADANVLSESMRPFPDPRVLERLHANRDDIAIAAPVLHELRFGALRLRPSRRRRDLEDYLEQVIRTNMPILPYDAAAAEWHADERARLMSFSRTPPYVDGQIAAIAAVNGLTLVTANMADFATFSGLQVEDWRS